MEVAWRQAESYLPAEAQTHLCEPLAKEDLRKAAADCRGTAPGIDGWSAEELQNFSDDIFDELAQFCQKYESLNKVPKSWKTVR